MADKFGAIELPLVAPTDFDAGSDPALAVVGAAFQAVLNVNANLAWQALVPSPTPIPVVKKVFTHDPHDYVFNEKDLPALFLWRTKGRPSWMAEDIEVFDDEAHALWVYAPADQEKQRRRNSFTNGILKVLQDFVEKYRSPAYVADGDPDPQAATLSALPDAIKLSVATSTSSHSYSGASLDGAIGPGAVSPPRPVTIALGGSSASFADGSSIVVTGVDVVGQPMTWTSTISVVSIPTILTAPNDFDSVVSVTVDAQAGTSGTITVGVGAFVGHGSLLLEQAGLQELLLSSWQDTKLTIQMGDQSPARNYYAVDMTLAIREELTYDLTTRDALAGSDVTFVREDGSVIEQARY